MGWVNSALLLPPICKFFGDYGRLILIVYLDPLFDRFYQKNFLEYQKTQKELVITVMKMQA